MGIKHIFAATFAIVSIIVIAAPTQAAAPAPATDEITPHGCMRQGGPCPHKDEGFTSWCCNNLTCRGGKCGG